MSEQFEGIELITNDIDENNITEVLKRWEQATNLKISLVEYIDYLKNTIKGYLKTRSWEKYLDKETKINVSLMRQEKKTIDNKQLKMILSENQLARVMKTSVFDRLYITTPETRTRMKKYVKQ